MRSARFHAEAESELQAEATYYEQHSKGLGERFAREVEAAVKVACSFPYIGSPYKYGTRRVYPKKFPFSVVYLVRSEEVLVLPLHLLQEARLLAQPTECRLTQRYSNA